MRRIAMLLIPFATVSLGGSAADAAVKKFRMNTINVTESPDSSPPIDKVGADEAPSAPFDTAFVDDSTAGAPVLKKLRFKSLSTTTVDVPQIAGPGSTIFLANNFLEGQGPFRKPQAFTGTGHTADGSTIAWGIVTGWTISGAQYCHSSPPVICSLAGLTHETTLNPAFHSDFYDLGTWVFHGTGFTATPFVHQFFTPPGNFGNNQRWIRGFFLIDATVPALPLLGVALLGGSLVVGGLSALRRRRRR